MIQIDFSALMDKIEIEHPLEVSYSEDGRYAWPERWAALRKAIKQIVAVGGEDDLPS